MDDLTNVLTGALWLDKGDRDEAITEKECRLCSRDRESVVLFEVHGNNKGKARRVIQIKMAQ